MPATERPALERILARNLIAATVTPAFVCDRDGAVTFFNEGCAQLIGRRFEESGRLSRAEWNAIGPVDEQGEPIADAPLPLRIALREHRPVVGRFRIKIDDGTPQEVEACVVPLIGGSGAHGALVSFVPVPTPR